MSDTITGIIEIKVTKQELIDCLPCGYCDIAAAIMDLPLGMYDQQDDALSKLRKLARNVVGSAELDDFKDLQDDWDELGTDVALLIEDRIEGLLKSRNDFAYTTRMKLVLLRSLLYDLNNEFFRLRSFFDTIRTCIKDIRRIVKESKP